MFLDTYDLWLDDDKTRKIKEYRRKSNYYEKKYSSLTEDASSITRLLSEMKRNDKLAVKITASTIEDVMR